MKLHGKLTGFLAALTASVALTATPSHALQINFYNGADLYATMTTAPATSFDLHFVGTGVAAGGFINELFMDGPTGTFTDLSVQTTASATYALNGFNGGGGAGNIYDWKIDFPNPNNASRLTIGEHGLWSITVTDPNAWVLNKIHINAFDANGNSIKIDGCVDGTRGCGSTSVPEPASLLLLGAGLAGFGIWRRKQA